MINSTGFVFEGKERKVRRNCLERELLDVGECELWGLGLGEVMWRKVGKWEEDRQTDSGEERWIGRQID